MLLSVHQCDLTPLSLAPLTCSEVTAHLKGVSSFRAWLETLGLVFSGPKGFSGITLYYSVAVAVMVILSALEYYSAGWDPAVLDPYAPSILINFS